VSGSGGGRIGIGAFLSDSLRVIAALIFAGFAAYSLLPRSGSERRFDFQRQVHSE
jgi:hypothetical protein